MDDRKSRVNPPGFLSELNSFKTHFEVSNGGPILLVGATGVGKSCFIELFKKLYHKQEGQEKKILELDCSHFVGTDSSIARSELFGHKKGAFTGAVEEKIGLLKSADGGALVLDEVGELAENVQAMLLTFIETGKFRPIGSKDLIKSDVQILAATNREKKLRKELRHRFFPYYISPLYRRRTDILHYFAMMFGGFLKQLHPWEILTLGCYNWPGNVREIDRIGKHMQYAKREDEKNERFGTESEYRNLRRHTLQVNDPRISEISIRHVFRFRWNLVNAGVDVVFLNDF